VFGFGKYNQHVPVNCQIWGYTCRSHSVRAAERSSRNARSTSVPTRNAFWQSGQDATTPSSRCGRDAMYPARAERWFLFPPQRLSSSLLSLSSNSAAPSSASHSFSSPMLARIFATVSECVQSSRVKHRAVGMRATISPGREGRTGGGVVNTRQNSKTFPKKRIPKLRNDVWDDGLGRVLTHGEVAKRAHAHSR